MLDISLLAPTSSPPLQRRFPPRLSPRRRARAARPLPRQSALRLRKAMRRRRRRSARAKSVILVYLGGGISHHDTFDLKPDAPEEIRGKYKADPDQRPRPARRRAAAEDGADRWTRSPRPLAARTTTTITRRRPTGCCPAGSARPSAIIPAMGAVVAHETGFSGMRAAVRRRAEESRRSPGNSARARGSAGATSRSRRAIRTPRISRCAISPCPPAVTPQALERRAIAARRPSITLSAHVQGQRPDRDLRRVPAEGRGDDSLAEGAGRLRHRQGAGETARRLRPHTSSARAACWRGGWSKAACASSPSTTAAGIITPRFSRASTRSCRSSTRASPR